MTKSIIGAFWVITMLTAVLGLSSCAKEDESRPPLSPPPVNKPEINTGREFKPENFPNIANSIYGAWDADTAEFGQGLTYLLSLYFNDHDEVGMKRTCVGSGEEVAAATVVDGEVTTSKIKITQTAQVLEKGGRISDCSLTVNTGSFSYKRTGDRLEVTFEPGNIRSFTRVKK